MLYTDKNEHAMVIILFLKWINKQTNRFILKGGTALNLCYGLDRFSEDIDLDSEKGNISNLVKNFCKHYKYTYNEKKDTYHGQRFLINYGIDSQLLKIETSLRHPIINKKFIVVIDGVVTYTLDRLLLGKVNAFMQRDRIRDLYDLCYFVTTKFSKLESVTKNEIRRVLLNKTMNQYEVVIKDQKDDLITKKDLLDLVIKAYDIVSEK